MDGSPPTEPDAIARALGVTFPELAPLSVRGILGSGFNSIAVETNGGLVFRIAKTPGSAERYAREQRLLPVLREHLPIAVPEPRWFVESSPALPHGAMGYPKIEGRPLWPSDLDEHNIGPLAGQVAGVLLALHRIPLAEVEHLGLASHDERPAGYRALRAETMPAIRERMSADEVERIERWWESFLSEERMTRFEPVVAHGDFWFENMIVDDGATQLVGVVDWEHAALADPALDFSTVLHLGVDFLARTLGAYRVEGGRFDAEDMYRMGRLWELRHFYGVLYSVRFQDREEMGDSIRKIREGPLFDTPGAP
ncbi:MAG: phosphotransferase [Dehalococcoidia bacterium]